MHELGHAVAPDAEARQWRSKTADGWLVAPRVEAEAWRFALDNACVWTAECHRQLSTSLASYSMHATAAERTTMQAVVRASAAKVTDSPVDAADLTKSVKTIEAGDAVDPFARGV